MSSRESLDQQLREAFSEPAWQLPDDFEARVMARLPSQVEPKRSPRIIIAAYWLLAAVAVVLVFAGVQWRGLELPTSGIIAAGFALLLVAGPVALLAHLLRVRITELLWVTVDR